MRTAQERIAILHRRAGELRREREKKLLIAWGSASGCLFGLLMVLIAGRTDFSHALGGGMMAGSSMLDESVGGYVLIAVIAFAAGAVITAAIRRYRERTKQRGDPDSPGEQCRPANPADGEDRGETCSFEDVKRRAR